MARTIFVLSGLNPNLLGKHQPEIFGRGTPTDAETGRRRASAEPGFAIQFRHNEAEHISNVPLHEEFRHFSQVSLALQHPAQRFKA